MRRTARNIYRALRSLAFTVILVAVGLVACLYVALSLPWMQKKILGIACREISTLLGGTVEAESMTVSLFDEIVLKNVSLTSPAGEKCISVGTLGAGIDLWRLVTEGRIEVTYAEILDPDIRLSQEQRGGPLNIRFMIDALAPKDKTKPPTKFDLNIRTVVMRRGHLRFDKKWCPALSDPALMDFNHIVIDDLAVDMSIPQLKNDDFVFNLRRLSFKTPQGLRVERIECITEIAPTRLALKDFNLRMPGTQVTLNDLEILPQRGFGGIVDALREGEYTLSLEASRLTPADFSSFWRPLGDYRDPLALQLDARGNMHNVDIKTFNINGVNGGEAPVTLKFRGSASGLDSIASCRFLVDYLDVHLQSALTSAFGSMLRLKELPARMLGSVGDTHLTLKGRGNMATGRISADLKLSTAPGSIQCDNIEVRDLVRGKYPVISGQISMEGLNIGQLLGRGDLGNIALEADANLRLSGGIPDGDAQVHISSVSWRGFDYRNISIAADKDGDESDLAISVDTPGAIMEIGGYLKNAGSGSELQAEVNIVEFTPSYMGLLSKWPGYVASGTISVDVSGNTIDNLTGLVRLEDFVFKGEKGKPSLRMHSLTLESDIDEEAGRDISIYSDLMQGYISGKYRFSDIVPAVKDMMAGVLPSLIGKSSGRDYTSTGFDFNFTIRPDEDILDFFKLPVKPLTDVSLSGSFDGEGRMADINLSAPYLQQGKNKLVSATSLKAVIDGESGTATVGGTTTMPVKFGDLTLNLDAAGHADNITAALGWHLPDAESMSGNLGLDVSFDRDIATQNLDLNLRIEPSSFLMNGAEWNIGGGEVVLKGKRLDVERLLINHGDQFVRIEGTASQLPTDSLQVTLANIDLGYIFDTLNINFVTFGGKATGSVSASSLFTSDLRAATDRLYVADLSYNGSRLGDADLESHFDMQEKMVAIGAVIRDESPVPTVLNGGIWVTRDSLSFDVDANRVNVGFLQPFMAAFSSGLEGRASGHAKLFGTFKDIDLTGRVFADTLRMKVDYTNTWYAGSDSVILDKGKITVPSFRLYDRDGNSGIFSGTLQHKYFREPVFDFRLTDAHDLLCYDTDSRINPDWYGTVYGNGTALISGRPGFVGINIDMTTQPRSSFTLVLNDTQAAEEYRFLSFRDHRREKMEAEMPDTVPEFMKRFKRNVAHEEGPPTEVSLDIRGTITPGALMTLVMDPAGGDRITARGSGAMQMEYNSESNEMKMFGRYTLDEGNYNFSLQDIILKDFSIRPGSTISFNGDPMNADLDIAATYRVNTNLTDLDQSFATDRDLNRTNVPVDAVLMVRGAMTSPDITFDIDLPTLTEEVGRKVRSLISTDDMMSRQIIYLLALNRFYTPEYSGSSQASGSEFSAIASSTLSSQLSNVLSNLTDNLTVSPSIRSDKGDFSDFEMDLALSSRLLNNRLLINGNFGYRDRATSSTTFVGDFDIEYLLSRTGNLRLKAYNHFNDQNYYLRSALTTQGIGIVFRKEFDNIFSFLRPLKRKKEEKEDDTKEATGSGLPELVVPDSITKKNEHDTEY